MKILRTSVAARRAFINERKLCRKCLRYHYGRCPVTNACGIDGCNLHHHALLHQDDGLPGSSETSAHETKGIRINTHLGTNEGVLLKYIPVVLHGPKAIIETYAFLDDGSTSTFMDHELVDELGLKGTPHPLCVQWTGDVTREEKNSVRLAVRISGKQTSTAIYELSAVRTVRKLALPKQSMNVSQLVKRYAYLQGLPLESYANAEPRLLIGVDNCSMGQSLRSVEGRRDEPIASKTRLVWVLGGPCSVATNTPGSTLPSFHICVCNEPDDGLTAAVKEHFALESIGIDKTVRLRESKDNERALTLLERKTKFDGHRYETGLLWRYDDIKLPCNRSVALKRYVCLQRKLKNDPILAKAVREKMADYKEKGYIRRLTDDELNERSNKDWYLPIFPVVNPNKPGKIRMVFDAAAKVRGVSLNSFLLPGPDMLAGLLPVLFKFREFRVGIVGDIREMFHRVNISKEDQRSQMIFWEGDDPYSVYVVTVMTFGASCSPSAAQYVKNLNADRFNAEYPRAVESIKDEHYVDDMLASVEQKKKLVN